jgi:hypothetical protein
MYCKRQAREATKGAVQFKTTKGRLQIVFSYPIEENGEIKRKRFYISTGYDDTPLNRQQVGGTVSLNKCCKPGNKNTLDNWIPF